MHIERRPASPVLAFADTASAYVKAAQSNTEEAIAIIKQNLADPAMLNEYLEHNQALHRAVKANNLPVVLLILAQANAKDGTAILPFGSVDNDEDILIADVINSALKFADAAIIKLLLQQKMVQEFLRTIRRDHHTFTLLCEMFAKMRNVSAGYELILTAANGKEKWLPAFLKQKESAENIESLFNAGPAAPPPVRMRSSKLLRQEISIDPDEVAQSLYARRKQMLYGFKCLTEVLSSGFAFYVKDAAGNTTKETNSTSKLPLELIHKIYGMIDYADYPVTTAQILRLARPAVT